MSREPPETILLLERDILVRTAVATYLRGCGYRVIVTANTDEALTVLQDSDIAVGVAVIDAKAEGSLNGFALTKWVERHREGVKTMMIGTPERAVVAAGALCEDGPAPSSMHLNPQLLRDEIRRLLASRSA